MYHVRCLADHFISNDATVATTSGESSALMPTTGSCPTCAHRTHWSELVRGAFRRDDAANGKLKKAPVRRGKKAKVAMASEEQQDDADGQEHEEVAAAEDDVEEDEDDSLERELAELSAAEGAEAPTPKTPPKRRAARKVKATPARRVGRPRKSTTPVQRTTSKRKQEAYIEISD